MITKSTLVLITVLGLTLFLGCNTQTNKDVQDTRPATIGGVSDKNETVIELQDCEYNKEYDSQYECDCKGMWRKYINFSFGCIDNEIKNMCREIKNNALASEIILELSENVSLNQAKKFFTAKGFRLLRYPCNFSLDSVILIDVGIHDLDKSLMELNNSTIVRRAHKNRVTGLP